MGEGAVARDRYLERIVAVLRAALRAYNYVDERDFAHVRADELLGAPPVDRRAILSITWDEVRERLPGVAVEARAEGPPNAS